MRPNELPAELGAPTRMGPFRRAVLRGLGILLPPLLTIVIFLWVANTVAVYLLEPLEDATRYVMVEYLADIRTPSNVDVRRGAADKVIIDGKPHIVSSKGTVTIEDKILVRTADGKFIPLEVHEFVDDGVGRDPMPRNAKDIYKWYVNHKWLPRRFVVPIFLCLFLLVLYSLGKFLAAGVGRFFWTQLERIIHRVPLVRNVYGSVKQVTDFLFTESDIHFTRVVAIEYPRKGIWTVCFATGEGMWDIRGAAKEPVITVFVPTSPMPFTGFVLTVKKSEVVELAISIDQAIQFVVSCGVVIPPPIIGVPQKDVERQPQPSLDMAR
ncbi:MAG: DUF502 domain-containing protein [Pirellulales bacterium]